MTAAPATVVAPMPDPAAVLAELDWRIVAWARQHTWDDWEDAAQEGRLGALLALPRWDSSYGVPATAFCWRRAKGAMLDHYRREHGRTDAAPRPQVVSYDDFPTDRRPDLALIERGYDTVEDRTEIARIVPHLTRTQREVVALSLRGLNLREVGEIRGTTESATCHLLKYIGRQVARPDGG